MHEEYISVFNKGNLLLNIVSSKKKKTRILSFTICSLYTMHTDLSVMKLAFFFRIRNKQNKTKVNLNWTGTGLFFSQLCSQYLSLNSGLRIFELW